MMALRPGTLFATHYEVARVISTGGMGVVYEVIDRNTKRRRALKVMLPHVVTDPLMRDRFALEAVVTADIESEHLVEVFDAGIDAETEAPYLVMELLRGEDLGARLKRGERFGAAETITYLEQVARALEKTHERGIVHRDLKPENLFLTRRDDGSPRVKILDFGIAKIVASTTGSAQSTTKSLGTPYYMAREQITGEAPLIGPASDLYAVAQIGYSMLVGAPYFEEEAVKAGGNVLALLLAVGKGPVEPATLRAEKRGVLLPIAFDAWFERGTRSAPSERFSSAREMIEELRRALEEPIKYASLPPEAPRESRPSVAATPRSAGPLPLAGTAPMPASPSAASVAHDALQTGSPQSIPRLAPGAVEGKPSPLKVPAIAGALVAVAAGVWLAWGRSPSSPGPSAPGSEAALSAGSSGAALAHEAPSVTAVGDATATSTATASERPAGSAGSSAAAPPASASATASASAGSSAPRARPPGPRTASPTAAPIWETR